MRSGSTFRRDHVTHGNGRSGVLFVVVLALAGTGCSTVRRDTFAARPPAGTESGVKAALTKVPLSFVENESQVDGPVSYCGQGADTSLYFTPAGVTFALSGGGSSKPSGDFLTSSKASPPPRAVGGQVGLRRRQYGGADRG